MEAAPVPDNRPSGRVSVTAAALGCGALSVALGASYLIAAGAPRRYLLVNGGALLVAGVLAMAGRALRRRLARRPVHRAGGAAILAVGLLLVATAVAGVSIGGARRWIAMSGIAVQPSLVLLPAAIVAFARRQEALAVAGLAIAGAALALQPDRAMAAAIVAGLAAILAARPGSQVALPLAAASVGLGVACLRPDAVPPVAFVEQVLPSAVAFHPLAGLAVGLGLLTLLAPAPLASRRGGDRTAALAFGAVWLSIVAASLLGPYPTPLVGYGSSAILGYGLSAAWLE